MPAEKQPLRLKKRLLLDGRIVPLHGEQVRLGLSQVGEGLLRIARGGRSPLGAFAELFVSVGDSQEYQVITGIVWRVRPGGTDWMLHVHEVTQGLRRRVLLRMDACDASEVVAEVGLQCGLKFLLPANMPLLKQRQKEFNAHNLGSEVLSMVGKFWNIPGAVWTQLPDGQVYWGPWTSAPFVGRPLRLEPILVQGLDLQRGIMEMPYLPAFRPGVVVEIPLDQKALRVRIDELTFSGQTMRVHWSAC